MIGRLIFTAAFFMFLCFLIAKVPYDLAQNIMFFFAGWIFGLITAIIIYQEINK